MGDPHLSRFPLRRVIARFLSLCLCVSAAAPLAARPLEDVRATGVLRVTVYRDFKPYSWIENGRARGIDVEIAEGLARKLGVKADFNELRADDNLDDDLRNGVWKGTILGRAPGDVMMHVPFDKTIEAKNDLVKLTGPYHNDRLVLIVASKKAAEASDFALFEKEKIGVVVGSLADLILMSARDRKLIRNVVHFRNSEGAAQAFERGEVQALYGPASEIEPLRAQSQSHLAILSPPTSLPHEWSLGLAIRTNAQDLSAVLAQALETMKNNGEMERIFAGHGIVWANPATTEE